MSQNNCANESSSNSSCSHIEQYKTVCGYQSFGLVHGFFVACIGKKSREAKAKQCSCRETHCRTKFKRVHGCLFCPFFGCFGGNHIRKHAEERKHWLAIDTNFGYVYCFKCEDYKYDYQFENIAMQHERIIARRKSKPIPYLHIPFRPWLENIQVLTPVYNEKGELERDVGLRGIVNMGNTCYMSCIFQALFHAPVITDYFLSDSHKCKFQQIKALEDHSPMNHNVCFCCEMGSIVQEFYSGRTGFYIPSRFLYLFWKNVETLSGYDMHDAHEFLIEFLNVMHQHCERPNEKLTSSEHQACCMMDEVFTGFSHTEYACKECNNKTTQVDSFKHISLPLNWSSIGKGEDKMHTLTDSLQRMTQQEIHEFNCNFCQSSQKECYMEMKVLKLPHIIIFYLNRLSPTTSSKASKIHNQKYDKLIEFPEEIDMNPYVQFDSQHPCLSTKFFLLAVVVHIGDSITGHYVTYVKKKARWYLCDDETIKLIDLKQVKEQPAYLLFYHRDFNNGKEAELTNSTVEVS